MSLRQLARQLKPHNLAGFWQGSSVLAPHLQEQNAPSLSGQSALGQGLYRPSISPAPSGPAVEAQVWSYAIRSVHLSRSRQDLNTEGGVWQTRAFAALPVYEEPTFLDEVGHRVESLSQFFVAYSFHRKSLLPAGAAKGEHNVLRFPPRIIPGKSRDSTASLRLVVQQQPPGSRTHH